jgi:hypothetical protein
MIFNNNVSNSENCIKATNCQNNIVQNTTFSDIESDEYRLLEDSSLRIIGQQFEDTVISDDDEIAVGNLVEIVHSGSIDVTDGGDSDDEDDGSNGDSHGTDNEPYSIILNNDDSITVNSS